jgi:hypothetical protein
MITFRDKIPSMTRKSTTDLMDHASIMVNRSTGQQRKQTGFCPSSLKAQWMRKGWKKISFTVSTNVWKFYIEKWLYGNFAKEAEAVELEVPMGSEENYSSIRGAWFLNFMVTMSRLGAL